MGGFSIEQTKLRGRRLTSKISVSEDLGKYLKNRELFIEYDSEIVADESILNIPLTAAILPLAWLTASNVYVNSLDKRFKESMDELQIVFSRMYPKAPFTTKIYSEKLIENKIGEKSDKTALLFSGGVDSTYSLIANLEKNPKLISIWGIDDFPYPEHKEHWDKTISVYREFAEKKSLDYYIIKTNLSQLLDERRIEHRFSKELYDGDIRAALQNSLIIIPITAPLSIERFNHLIIAATSTLSPKPSLEDLSLPRSWRPWTDEKIVWANLTVQHDSTINRNLKIRAICDYLRNDELTLRVCLSSRLVNGYLNDSECEKCLRTIAALLVAGCDPNICGFNVNESTIEKMWRLGEKGKLTPVEHWTQIQGLIPEVVEEDLYGSREFFKWFRGYDFTYSRKKYFIRDLYSALPYSVARYLDKVYKKLGINIHGSPDIRKPHSH